MSLGPFSSGTSFLFTIKILRILGVLGILSGCGGIQKIALSTTSELLYKASFELQNENHYETFAGSILPNLKIAEGLLTLSPTDLNLLATLTKGHCGYAFGVLETQILELKLKSPYEDKDEDAHQKKIHEASHHYSKAIDYGLRFLNEKNINYTDLQKNLQNEKGIVDLLKKKNLDEKAQEVVLYLAQALGSLINLNRGEMILVSQLPIAHALFDYICEINPTINHGTCDIFYATYEVGRPAMLGGNPKKGREIFLNFSHKYPQNELGPVLFMEYVLLPNEEDKIFNQYLDSLLLKKEKFRDLKLWKPSTTNKGIQVPLYENLNLFRAIAFKRIEIFEQNRKTIFK